MTRIIYFLSVLAGICLVILLPFVEAQSVQSWNTKQEGNINIDTLSPDIPPDQVREILHYLSGHGRNLDLVNFLLRVEKARGSLDLDRKTPPIYSFLGVALYSLKRVDEAVEAFHKCIQLFPNDTRPYINLGEIQVQRFKLDEAAEAFKNALRLGEYSALPRIMRTNGWALNWKDWETFQIDLERLANNCAENINNCQIDANSGLEYTDASGYAFRVLTAISPNSQTSLNPIRANKKAIIWKKYLPNRRLKVGFVSSDFGIHPVATLIRGMLQYLNKNRFEIFCFAVNPAMSWWGGNISTAVEHFHIMNEFNLHEAAEYIASFKIEILIDLNGHTMFSGLPIMAFKPAPLQYSFLGLPTTTGAQFIDYYLSDYITIPPEQKYHFSENIALMKPCYIVNDYAQVQGTTALTRYNYFRADRDALQEELPWEKASLLLATLSNSQKMDPVIFHVWMNIMHGFAGSQMVYIEYAGHEVYKKHMRASARYFGIDTSRIVFIPQAPWIDHLYAKTALDLILDTPAKNAHTTGLDGIFAGIPSIALAGGVAAESRAGESIAVGLGSELGLAYSLKDYEDLAFRALEKRKAIKMKALLAKQAQEKGKKGEMKLDDVKQSLVNGQLKVGPGLPKHAAAFDAQKFLRQYPLLVAWREEVAKKRVTSPLFNTKLWTKSFEFMLQASWEIAHLKKYYKAVKSISPRENLEEYAPGRNNFHVKTSGSGMSYYQIFSPVSDEHSTWSEEKGFVKPLVLDQVYSEDAALIPDELTAKIRKGEYSTNLATWKTLREIGKAATPVTPSQQRSATQIKSSAGKAKSESQPAMESATSDTSEDKFIMNPGKRSIISEANTPAKKKKRYAAIPNYVFDGRLVMLNVGGVRNAEGWLIVNSQKSSFNMTFKVDIVREMHDFKGFPNSSASAIYSSHTLEHAPFGGGIMMKALHEWYRILRPGGLLMIAVPDLSTLARMYLDETFTIQEKWKITQMIYGAQNDEYDFHHTGFNEEILTSLLAEAGFCNISRASYFNIGFKDPLTKLPFSDSSEIVYKGYFISLNLVAYACPAKKLNNNLAAYDGFMINHNAFPYFGYKIDQDRLNQYIQERFGPQASVTIQDSAWLDETNGSNGPGGNRGSGSGRSSGAGAAGASSSGASNSQGASASTGSGASNGAAAGEKKEMKFGTKRRRRRSSN